MSASAVSDPPGPQVSRDTATLKVPIIVEPEPEVEERGRLKRRRLSSHSPRRASSPSRGHERRSGSRYRAHHRKHHRPSSPLSSVSPPTLTQKKARRRSDAEPDHTFRGRVRNRSGNRGQNESTILEDDDAILDSEDDPKSTRKRSAPPSRHRADRPEEEEEEEEIRRQRSYPNLYMEERRGSKSGGTGKGVLKNENERIGHEAPVAQTA